MVQLDNLDELDKILGAYDLPKLNQEAISNLKRSIMSNRMEE